MFSLFTGGSSSLFLKSVTFCKSRRIKNELFLCFFHLNGITESWERKRGKKVKSLLCLVFQLSFFHSQTGLCVIVLVFLKSA